jgi:hypothetical protein
VPGDVRRELDGLERVQLVGIEGLRQRAEQNRSARQSEVQKAAPLVERAVERTQQASAERLLAEMAGRLTSLVEQVVAAQPLPAGYEAWPRLLAERAQKVLMARVRQRIAGCGCFDAATLGLVLDDLQDEVPKPPAAEPQQRVSFAPAELDRRAFRRLQPEQQAVLEQWFHERALHLSRLASGIRELLEARCTCDR